MIPKVELHVHIEGTLEAELMVELARRNDVAIPHTSAGEVHSAHHFRDLQSFLDLYYQGASVLLEERDFFDLTWAYLRRAAAEDVRHVEVFFDPQAHTVRGVAFSTVVRGIHRALSEAASKLGVSSKLILCFLRDCSPASAMETLESALDFREWIAGAGLDSAERNHPPRDFIEVFDRARSEGLRAVAHAGEEGPPEYIWEALDLLKAERIDHGVRCTGDRKLVGRLARERIPLTVCPLSNVQLRVFESLGEHNLKQLLDLGLAATINSDDPAYFGGYITENFLAAQRALGLTRADIVRLVSNAIDGSFSDANGKRRLHGELKGFVQRDMVGPL